MLKRTNKTILSMKTFNYLIIFILIPLLSSAQPWMDLIPKEKQSQANFYEIQQAFNTYWNGRQIVKHTGYKQFKRWETYMQNRVDETGFIPAEKYWKAMLQVSNDKKNARNDISNWQEFGPHYVPKIQNQPDKRTGIGRIDCIAFDPNDENIIWVGAPTGGLWKTSDGGQTWATFSDQLPTIGISDIVIRPDNPDIMYIATGDRDVWYTYSVGILKSTDGGNNWQATGLSFNVNQLRHTNRLIMNPANYDEMLVATDQGIYKTTDGAVSWTRTQTGDFKDMEFRPNDFSTVYASTYNYSQGVANIYKSTDSGTSFEVIDNVGFANGSVNRIALAVSPSNPDFVYAYCCAASNNDLAGAMEGFYKSVDNGINWEKTVSGEVLNLLGFSITGTDPYGQGWYNLSIDVSPNDANTIFVGGANIWKSTDGGYNWEICSYLSYNSPDLSYVHPDHHCIQFNPLNNNVFSGNDGGFYKSENLGENWVDLSDGLVTVQVFNIAVAETEEDYMIYSPHDQGTIRYKNGVWEEIYLYEDWDCIIDYLNPNVIYTGGWANGFSRSINGGTNFTTIQPQGADRWAWLPPLTMHPQVSTTIYCGFLCLYMSVNQGNSWVQIDIPGLNSNIINIEISESNPDVIYVTTYNKIFRTDNAGANWQIVTPSLSSGRITNIKVDPANSMRIWCTFSDFSTSKKVNFSEDGGQSWTNFSDGLPAVPINCIVYQKNTNDLMYAGTDVGVYYRFRGMPQWEIFSNNLPNVIVNELVIQYTNGELWASTFGRGIWKTPLYNSNSEIPTAAFSANNTEICVNQQVEFTDESLGSPATWIWTISPETYSFAEETNTNSQNPVIIFEESGSYSITLECGNENGSNVLFRESYITVNPLPVANFSYETNQLTVQFIDNSTEAHTWEWNFGDGTQSNETSPAHTYSQTGEYIVNQTVENNCGENSFELTVPVTASIGILESNFSEKIKVYPNPTKGIFYIEYLANSTSQTKISIFNNSGELIAERTITNAIGINTEVFDLNEFAAGIYSIQIISGKHKIVKQVVVE